eukprot:g1782.t1
MLICSFLDPIDVCRLSLMNSEWRGLLASNIADIVLWRVFCLRDMGKVLSKQECGDFFVMQQHASGVSPHQDFYIRNFLLVHDFVAAMNCLLCSDKSIALISATTLMQAYGTLAARNKSEKYMVGNTPDIKIHAVAIKHLVSTIRVHLPRKNKKPRSENASCLVNLTTSKRTASVFEKNILISVEILICVTGALMNAALIGDSYRNEIIRVNGIYYFAKILEQHQSFDRLSKYASGALWNLSLNSRYCRHAICSYISTLILKLRYFWAIDVENACLPYATATAASCAGIVAACCSESYHENQIELMEAGGIEVLLLVISKIGKNISSGKKVVINCCAAIRNILMKQPRAQRTFRDSGGVASMMNIINPAGIWNCEGGRSTVRSAAAVLVNSTNEDNLARREVDTLTLCRYVLHPGLASSEAVIYTGILQNITCGIPQVNVATCEIIVECCYFFLNRVEVDIGILADVSSNNIRCLVPCLQDIRELRWIE